VQTYLAQDVPTAIEGAFRVRSTGWGIAGESTGGYCAVKIAMVHSDVFTAAVALSGYYRTVRDVTTGDLWGGSSVLRQLNDPLWRLDHLPAPPISLFATIGAGEKGASGLRNTRQMERAVHSPMSMVTVVVPRAGHNYADWSSQLPRALDWLSGVLDRRA
jgi:S-formylglutathione hydrolase FrmB